MLTLSDAYPNTPTSYRPADCAAPCRYPDETLATGSGHHRQCPAHARYQANGNTWRPQSTDPLKDTPEARRLLDALPDDARLPSNAREFVRGLRVRFEAYGEQTYISPAQMNWLRDLEKRFA